MTGRGITGIGCFCEREGWWRGISRSTLRTVSSARAGVFAFNGIFQLRKHICSLGNLPEWTAGRHVVQLPAVLVIGKGIQQPVPKPSYLNKFIVILRPL